MMSRQHDSITTSASPELCLLTTIALLLSPCRTSSEGSGGTGCTDSAASNYQSSASADDGSCTYKCGSELKRAVGAPERAQCFLYEDNAWDQALVAKAADGVLTVDAAWVVQGKPLAGTTLAAPDFPYRFVVDSGKDLTLRFARFVETGHASPAAGGGLKLTGGTARLVAALFSSTAAQGGAIYAESGSDLSVTRAIFQQSSALTGGAVWAENSRVSFSNCTFDHTKTSAHGGGAIFAKDCDLVNITNTLFDGCTAGGGHDGPDDRGDALHLGNCAKILITGTKFKPFDDIKTVVFDTSWLATVGGCAENPCEPGFSCTYAQYSRTCTPCEENTFSTDGISCRPCVAGEGPNKAKNQCVVCSSMAVTDDGPMFSTDGKCTPCPMPNVVTADRKTCNKCNPGSQPNVDQTQCVPCGPGNFSTFGVECQACPKQNVLDAKQTTCTACQAGRGPNEDRTKCEPCTGQGNYSTFGVCQTCPEGKIPEEDRTSCRTPFGCPPGQQCPPSTTCKTTDQCEQCEAGSISPYGEGCDRCSEDGKHANDDQTACVACEAGKQPSADRSKCNQCPSGNFSTFGIQCQVCPKQNVLDAKQTTCTVCQAGQGPSKDRTKCERCTKQGQYSTFGVCQTCPSGQIPNEDHTNCRDPEQCSPGKQCPDGKECGKDTSLCESCPIGQVSPDGTSCNPCNDQGKRANDAQTDCVECGPGTQPSKDKSKCESCPAGNFSSFGLECQECKRPNIVTNKKAACTPCQAGQGPNKAATDCETCTGTLVSTLGKCEPCESPNVVLNGHTKCAKCEPGKEPNIARTACIPCEGGNFSSFGVRCDPCLGAANIVDDKKAKCTPCPAGRGPLEPDRSECVQCSGTAYSISGVCLECPAPNIVNEARTECTPCPASQGPNTVRTKCEQCGESQFSKTGSCQTCPSGQIPNEDHTNCRDPEQCSPGKQCPDGKECGKDTSLCESCPIGQVSPDGTSCNPCNDQGKRANDAQTDCVECGPGTQPSKDKSKCESCPAGNFSSFGLECQECKRPNIVTNKKAACTPCQAGQGPNKAATDCETCTGTLVSTLGKCEPCESPNVVLNGHTKCAKCEPGKEPNIARTACIPCEGGNFSSFGVRCDPCLGAAKQNVLDTKRTTCTVCQAGQGPNKDRTKCEPCTGQGNYSTFGVCQTCPEGKIPEEDRTSCRTPFWCPPGQQCPPSTTCKTTAQCKQCEAGSVSPHGEGCDRCSEDGKHANDDQTACVACEPGKQPSADRSKCNQCPSGTFSSFGVLCQNCTSPRIVGAKKVGCEACPAGYGPNEDYTDCEHCDGTTFSTLGKCEECKGSNVVDKDHQTCISCRPGSAPNGARNGCVRCDGGNFSNFGIKCQICPQPSVVNKAHTECTPCKAGEGPSPDHTTCERCTIQGEFSKYGRCETCPEGKIPEEDRTGCRRPFSCPAGKQCVAGVGKCVENDCKMCGPGQVSVSEGTNCVKCANAGQYSNPEHTSCVQCPKGKQPSADRNSCDQCNGTTYSPDGYQCRDCISPRVVGTSENFPNSLCQECNIANFPERGTGKGPNLNHTGCVDCTGNKVSTSGECVLCKAGEVASPKRIRCNKCRDREAYDPGSTESSPSCACAPTGGKGNNGYYDASTALIVCFHDEFNQFDVDTALEKLLRESGNSRTVIQNKCQECPECADCSSGVPVLRDGYSAERTVKVDGKEYSQPSISVARVSTNGKQRSWQVHAAFLCDVDTSVTPTEISMFGYFTSKLANERCRRSESNSVMLPVLNYSAVVDVSADGSSSCSPGYAGIFCQSCDLDYAHNGRVCVPCMAASEFTETIWIVAITIPSLLLLLCCGRKVWLVKKQNASFERNLQGGLNQSLLNGSASDTPEPAPESEPHGVDSSVNHYDQTLTQRIQGLWVAMLPPLKIIVTYGTMVGPFKALIDLSHIWSIFVDVDCLGYGDFYSEWWRRVAFQPLFLSALVAVWTLVDWSFSISESQERLRQHAVQNLLRGIFLCYPSVCNICFSTLNCRHDTSTTTVLVDDDRYHCEDPTHRKYQFWSKVFLALYGIGMPLCLAGRLIFLSYQAERRFKAADVTNQVQKELPPPRDAKASHTDSEAAFCPCSRKESDSELSTEQRESIQVYSQEDQLERDWREQWLQRYCCCCCCTKHSWAQKRKAKLTRRARWNATEDEVERLVEGAYIESAYLGKYSFLVEAYKPHWHFVYWESVDLARKLCLVGLVVLFGRGSVAQNFCSTVISFLFFALHIKMWPLKTNEDNMFRASCELHVFWTITTSFVMKADLAHEQFDIDDYDWLLLITFLICVPGGFFLTIWRKLNRVDGVGLPAPYHGEAMYIPNREFARYIAGVASGDDRSLIKRYFEDCYKDKLGDVSASATNHTQEPALSFARSSRTSTAELMDLASGSLGGAE